MRIAITKGEGTDRIEARRADGSTVGFELPKKGPLIPHDLVHLVVEQELGIADGFWGLVAAGWPPEAIGQRSKDGGHASAARASAPAPEIVPILQAERAVEAFEADLWSGGGDNETLRAMIRAGCEQSFVPAPAVDDAHIERIRARLIGFRDEWAQLDPGGSLSLSWPETAMAAE